MTDADAGEGLGAVLPQPRVTTRRNSDPLLWKLQVGAGLLLLVAVIFGVVAHQLRPGVVPWRNAVGSLLLAVCFLASGARQALRTGVVRRRGWWHSGWILTSLTGLSLVTAVAAMVLGLVVVFGGA